jgi:hypothetical protein
MAHCHFYVQNGTGLLTGAWRPIWRYDSNYSAPIWINFHCRIFLNLKKRVKLKDEDVSSYTITGYEGRGSKATLNLGTIKRKKSTLGPVRFTPR